MAGFNPPADNSLFSATKRKARGYRSTVYQTAMLYFVAGKLEILIMADTHYKRQRSMFRLYSCSFGIACQKWHHDAAGCQKDSHLRVPNTQMAHIVAREELIDRSFYPLETSRNHPCSLVKRPAALLTSKDRLASGSGQ